ncbi:GumC family protein [Cellulophaga tyrosinoxydans]|uniref:non-specific protein-tyrosine kinase n=1 Tax=Cellulophaga tyrosinoxydans TaxID=504486 RepID=A0A1W2AQ27_9FLAO|nr:tyrosine-protein kinase domain-containing protein [Cellulophaga tyrosinoxydans]SMC62829.1 capsular exopolysaccharide family [Cellulophaga tyrosinoxydans]
MSKKPFSLDLEEKEDVFDLKKFLLKYYRQWPYFLLGLILCVAAALFEIRYTPVNYQTVAKIKITDDKQETDIASEAAAIFTGGTNVNLDNEIEVIRSYRLIEQVVKELHLDVSYYDLGTIKTTQIWEVPFDLKRVTPDESVYEDSSFKISIHPNYFKIITDSEKEIKVPFQETETNVDGLPFTIRLKENEDYRNYEQVKFLVTISPVKDAVLNLLDNLSVEPTNKKSEILTLSLAGENAQRSEIVLNEIINKFNRDGILDRQLVSKRTIDFIDERFLYLTQELDSIEAGKQDFKQTNSLSYIEADASVTLQNKSLTENELVNVQTQISIARLLKQSLMNQDNYSLLPADIGVSGSNLNLLVAEYNNLVLEREKLLVSVGESHPTLRAITTQLDRSKTNILATVNSYQNQLKASLSRLTTESNITNSDFAKLPEKEKALREIERQQSIKENLFLLLLQKREEAAIKYAVTAPSIKVVDFAITDDSPIASKNKMLLGFAVFLGLFIPFAIIYLIDFFSTKIKNREDVEKVTPEVPIVGEMPFFKNKTSFVDANDRSVLSESFRILSTNINYLMPKKDKGLAKVIYVASSVKGEGKSVTSLNLSLTYASIQKRTLLIGADLRNPQLHTYFDINKDVVGLSNYLYDNTIKIEDCIHDGFGKNEYHKVCFSGSIPLNPTQLLSNNSFEKFINEVSKQFDYIIVDTAPTVLVTDTLLISEFADISLYVIRAGHTQKKVLDFVKELNTSGKIKNMVYLMNDIGKEKHNDYNYGYGYGYGESKKSKKSKK